MSSIFDLLICYRNFLPFMLNNKRNASFNRTNKIMENRRIGENRKWQNIQPGMTYIFIFPSRLIIFSSRLITFSFEESDITEKFYHAQPGQNFIPLYA